MSEIKKVLQPLTDYMTGVDLSEYYVITPNHTISDVLRHLVKELGGDKEEIKTLLDLLEE
jgi:hypothetical protein